MDSENFRAYQSVADEETILMLGGFVPTEDGKEIQIMIEEEEIWISEAQAQDLKRRLERLIKGDLQMSSEDTIELVKEDGQRDSINTEGSSDP